MAPRGYGLAWRDYMRPYIYFAPFPFHWLIGWARRAWYCCAYPRWEMSRGDFIARIETQRTMIKQLERANMRANQGLDQGERRYRRALARLEAHQRDCRYHHCKNCNANKVTE